MDNYQDSRCLDLEKALADESVAPIDLPFLFLKAITQDFSDNQCIGSGGFGSVYKGTLPNGMVAVKRLHNKIEVQEEDFQREVAYLEEVKHKNIVRFLGYCYETQHIRKLYQGKHVWADELHMLFCFEFLCKGSLANYVSDASSGLEWRVRYQIIKGICEGMSHLHKRCIIHRDLKPENILLDDSMAPKIIDFGISRRFRENQTKIITGNIVGSLGYMAPEFLSGTISFGTDIYSLGVIIIQILTGSKECPNVNKVLESWMNMFGTSKSNPPLEQVKLCAEIGIDCMHDDPSKRPDIQDIIRRLNGTDISVQAKQACKPMRITANVAPEVISRVCFQDIQDIDVHPTHPWILVGHGKLLSIWHYKMEGMAAVYSVDINDKAGMLHRMMHGHARVITSVRFIPRMEWCVAGDERGYIHVYACPKMDKIKIFKATGRGCVFSLAIHPTCPYLLSACRDDGVIEIWNWEKGWACSRKVQTGASPEHATFNPMDANTFGTFNAHDGLIKVWSINPSTHQPITTIKCPRLVSNDIVDHVFIEAAGRNHVVIIADTPADPQIWDLQTGTPVHRLGPPDGSRFRNGFHVAACHPTLPLIAAIAVADSSHGVTRQLAVCFWNSTNYRLEKTIRWTFRGYWIHFLRFVDSRRLVFGSTERIEVLEIDMESLACQQ